MMVRRQAVAASIRGALTSRPRWALTLCGNSSGSTPIDTPGGATRSAQTLSREMTQRADLQHGCRSESHGQQVGVMARPAAVIRWQVIAAPSRGTRRRGRGGAHRTLHLR